MAGWDYKKLGRNIQRIVQTIEVGAPGWRQQDQPKPKSKPKSKASTKAGRSGYRNANKQLEKLEKEGY